MKNLFGTDGIRGVSLTELKGRMAYLLGNYLASTKENCKILVGSDTRRSSNFFKSCLLSGIMLGGGKGLDLFVVPTPCVAYLTKHFRFDYGIMVSASHNPPEYNGLKVFDANGHKANKKLQESISNFIACDREYSVSYNKLGKVVDYERGVKNYLEFLRNSVKINEKTKSILVSCSNGATFKLAKEVFESVCSRVVMVNASPNGVNINSQKDKENYKNLVELTNKNNCDYGVEFDGDGDRLCFCDKNTYLDGDGVMYVLATFYKEQEKLKNNSIVGTVYSNLGFEKGLNSKGINLIRTDVGDSLVAEAIRSNDLSLGGEQSGHIIIADLLSTGDGMLAALKVLECIANSDRSLSDILDFKVYPQVLINVAVRDKKAAISSPEVNKLINLYNCTMKGGRILVRESGTENLIRVMTEFEDFGEATAIAKVIATEIAKH